jgi:hypothetical protein
MSCVMASLDLYFSNVFPSYKESGSINNYIRGNRTYRASTKICAANNVRLITFLIDLVLLIEGYFSEMQLAPPPLLDSYVFDDL